MGIIVIAERGLAAVQIKVAMRMIAPVTMLKVPVAVGRMTEDQNSQLVMYRSGALR
jgi:hypothetical protein